MKEKRASIAKITRPKVKGISPRKRLIQLLDASRNHPVTWVSGPAGCGKTSLVASYLDERRFPCIWYQVDEGDSDVASFFYFMGLAARNLPHASDPPSHCSRLNIYWAFPHSH